MNLQSFEELDCWKAARGFRQFIALEVVRKLPSEEKHRLGDQMIRSARSITANIAEGYGRFHYLDNSKFCSNARGSCYEVLDHLITAHDEGLVTAACLDQARSKLNVAIRLLNGYMAYLRRAAQNPPKSG